MAWAVVLSPLLSFWPATPPRLPLSTSWIVSPLVSFENSPSDSREQVQGEPLDLETKQYRPKEKQNRGVLPQNKTRTLRNLSKIRKWKLDKSTQNHVLSFFPWHWDFIRLFLPFLHYRQRLLWKAPSSRNRHISPLSVRSFRSHSSRSRESMSWHGKSHLSLKRSTQQPSITVLGRALRS